MNTDQNGEYPTKVCRKCLIKKPYSEFYNSTVYKDGRDYRCKPCRYTPRPRKYVRPWNKGMKAPFGIGEKHPCYKGGRNLMKSGYVRVLIPGTESYELEHRRVMGKYIGRKLRKDEDVHHLDGDKTNNVIENLLLCSRSEHAKIHDKMRGRDARGRFYKQGVISL